MQIRILCPLWGHETEDRGDFLRRVKEAGYDGIDAWMPDDRRERQELLDYAAKYELGLVIQQHQAQGKTFDEFKASFLHYLELSAEGNPLFINSHTGKDSFSREQNLELIDLAAALSRSRGVEVIHETHRGRFAFGPGAAGEYFKARPELQITADLSHWTCVTESFLEDFSPVLEEAIARTRHVHARIGYEEGPQVPDPRAPEWKYATDHFLGWWDRIVEHHDRRGDQLLTFTPEFGPPPYLQTTPFVNRPVADQFEINRYMKDLLRERYSRYFS